MTHAIRFCSSCGARLVEMQLPSEERPRLVCPECGFVHYVNPKIVSGTLPVEEGKVWLLRRRIEPRIGYWTHPAGYQEMDESTEQAAQRETLEELGCRVALARLIGVYSRPHGAVVNVVYEANLESADDRPHTTAEALEISAFAPGEIPWHDLAFPSTASALRDWLNRGSP